MRILKLSQYHRMPWKNGQGYTDQIAIYPRDADFSKDPFLWRISSARVGADGPFSLFPGYDRLLSIWRGAGLHLCGGENTIDLVSGMCHQFRGEETIEARLMSGPIVDLGVIFLRKKVEAAMELLEPEAARWAINAGENFLFCARGALELENLRISEGETASVSAGEEATGTFVQLKSLVPGTEVFRIWVGIRNIAHPGSLA